MPNYLNKIVYLTEAQKDTLFSTGSVTANGQTITYNANDLYFTTDGALPVSSGGTGQNSATNIFTDISWAAGNSSGPNLSVTILGQTRNAAIPVASSTASGVVTTGTQYFSGDKTFRGNSSFYGNSFTLCADKIRFCNNQQLWTNVVNNQPYVTRLFIGDNDRITLSEYRDDYLAIRAGSILLMTATQPVLYSNASTYSVGNIVYYDRNYYNCITAISTAEEWNASHWSQLYTTGITTAANLSPAINAKYDLGHQFYQWNRAYIANVVATNISGNGASISAINASNIASGTLPNNRLASVARVNNTSSATASHGGTFTAIDSITTDSYGRVTAINTKTITLPSDNDTKNTAGSTNNASKMYLIGALSQATNPQTYSHSAVYATNGTLYATGFSGNGASLTNIVATKLNTTQATATNKYYILGQEAAGNSTTYIATNYASGTENTAGVYFQGSTGVLMGAAWNDYAEFRAGENVEPGRVVREKGDDTLELAEGRLLRGCSIVSDTFGFGIGENNNNKLPIAVSGRVLAYPYESRDEFRKYIGYAVCSGPNGTVSIMTEQEERDYPSAIIGTISAVPDYEVWHGGIDVEIKNRIWIKVR